MEGSKLKARVICNPASSGGGYEPKELHREIEGYELEWITTESPGDAAEAAREWRDGQLIVVGGDGTISEVVNGLGQAGFPEGVTLAILPAGTGNDLAATLAIPEDPAEAVAVLRQNRVRTLDVVRVRSEGSGEQFFINVATGGMGAEVSGAADGEMKNRWGN
jgi:diacylglycerol kinase (ATP)